MIPQSVAFISLAIFQNLLLFSIWYCYYSSQQPKKCVLCHAMLSHAVSSMSGVNCLALQKQSLTATHNYIVAKMCASFIQFIFWLSKYYVERYFIAIKFFFSLCTQFVFCCARKTCTFICLLARLQVSMARPSCRFFLLETHTNEIPKCYRHVCTYVQNDRTEL